MSRLSSAKKKTSSLEEPVVKKEKVKKPHYVDPVVFSDLIVKSYKTSVVDDELANCILKIATRLAYAPNFINYCVDDQTEALTKRGWLNYKEITTDDEILSCDTTDNKLKWSKIKEIYVNESYSGQMHKLTCQGMDALVTPNHKFLISGKGLTAVEHICAKDKLILNGSFEDRKNKACFTDD